MASPLLLLLFFSLLSFASPQSLFPNPCGERCGPLTVPFPFHLNSSCGPPIAAFQLSCSDASALYLSLGGAALRVIAFRPSGSLLLDYSSNSSSSSSVTACDRWYSDIGRSTAVFARSPFFAVGAGNVLRLYDCEDSSVCRAGCEGVASGGGGCEGNRSDASGCCYPLSDGSAWRPGEGFSVFAEFGCRGFSSWAVTVSGSSSVAAQRGIEVEWAVPRGLLRDGAACADGAVAVNATAVQGGVRCACGSGFVGDGFAGGVGCFKSCSSEGQTNNNSDCCKGSFCRKKVVILTGVLVSAFFVAAIISFFFLLRQPIKENIADLDPACLPKMLVRACSTRQFTYEELDEATNGFEDDQKLVDFVDGTIHSGVLDDGSLVAVQKVKCDNQQNLRQFLERVEILSQISHRNIARTVGFCFDSNNTLLLVHEYFSTGTLREHLLQERRRGLSWYLRSNIATEVASALAYLQSEISTPIYLLDLTSSGIFLDSHYSAKIGVFKFLKSEVVDESCSYVGFRDSDVVYRFGLILLELVVGSKHGDLSDMVLPKINDRKFHEIVDPCLGFGDQPPFQREQIERVASLAVQCLSSKGNNGPSMFVVVKELICIFKANIGSSSGIEPALEETFSNSSLLQMISMSPDSLYVP